MPTKAYTFGECRDETRAFYRANGRLSADVINHAIDSLTDPKEMRAYFTVLQQIEAADILKGRKEGPGTETKHKLRPDVSTAEIAEERAYGQLKRAISYYSNQVTQTRWNAALPDLKSDGGSATSP